MRRLLPALPALAHWFHIPPWRVLDLTPEQLEVFLDALPKQKRR